MRSFALCLLLLLLGLLPAQDPVILGNKITPEELKKAEEQVRNGQNILNLAKQTAINMNEGEYLVIEPGPLANGPLLWMRTDESALDRIDVAAGERYSGWLKKKGEAKASHVKFPAKAFDWYILVAKSGRDTINIIKNGKANPPFASSGTYTASNRIFKIVSGKWPEWAGQGNLWVANNAVKVVKRVSDTDLELASAIKNDVTTPVECVLLDPVTTPPVALDQLQIVVGDAPPDPGPGPSPNPPGPDPKPVPGNPFRVILVSETSANLTREQLNVLNSTQIRDYLNRKCAKDEKGRAGWRSWDKDVDVSNESPTWKDLWTTAKPALGPLPQIIIVSGQKGKAYPLPATEKDTLDLLKKYGGE